ncbi:patatin-like phospholipase family protein [Dyella sp. S184]|uniref:patatin-like phospholipase family protein n=1 Tax=Dyella sp. S184 TaxID=1641862 RepID=UPI001C204B52|nr:patatin-like phospholipase family protein [Dyella sp. S184]
MARVHVLRGQDRVFGFTLDEQGTNLPRQYGPWITFKTIELHHDEPYQGVDVSACLDDISKHGFHLTAAHKRITHLALESEQAAHKNVALVLGGGGAAGNAWQIGIIAGLAEAGFDMTEAADLVIGTSSGATVAAHVRSGIPPAELLAAVLSPPVQPVGQTRDRPPSSPPSLPMATVLERMRAIGAAATSAADLRLAMGAFGLESDSTLGPAAAGQRRALVASRLPRLEWPDRPMIVVAVDAHTGELAAFDRYSGVDLVDAVTAATALPGMAPTHSINGTRYINGGVRSADNADLASGYANVVVLTPFSERNGPLPPGQFEGLRRCPEWGNDLASQVEALRKQGSHVEVITPDPESRAAMGTNQMDPATRIPASRAGFAQGKLEATRLATTQSSGNTTRAADFKR